jgi:bis(5'-nucleosyl)-tetraphosphatase (symmetrical)
MSLYLIGDLQGCNGPLQQLLRKIDFSPSTDTLYVLGDLVNRGPDSLGVLRCLASLGDSARCLLGNHDLHLLAVWQGIRSAGRSDTLLEVLNAPDRDPLMHWLRHRDMAIQAHGWLMVHAGVLPQWTLEQTMRLASEVERELRGLEFKTFLESMYGNTPAVWSDSLRGADRLRVVVNGLTRLRFCTPDGVMDFTSTRRAEEPPEGCQPWFDVAARATQHQLIAFGHWSTLSLTDQTPDASRGNALPLDTGCLWGGCLTAARLGTRAGEFELIQVQCEQAKQPG